MTRTIQQNSSSPDNPFGVVARGDFRLSSDTCQSELARTSRLAMGLSTDTPVVLSGHQSLLWHPGILAKRFAAASLADVHDGHAAWIVVDSDIFDGGTIVYPARDSAGNPARQSWNWAGMNVDGENTPTCCVAARPVASLPQRETVWNSGVFLRLQGIHHALGAAYDSKTTAAEQLCIATDSLLAPVGCAQKMHTIMASRLFKIPVVERLWRAMAADPESCVAAYNAAALQFPGSGIRSLAVGGGAFELPVWQIEKNRRRAVRIKAQEDASRIDATTLAPRALLLTAIARLALCDVFIHGLGGEVYDRVMERWLGTWLPTVADPDLRSLSLAPSIAVSATMRFEFEGVQVPTPQEIARHVWAAHHAKHNPGWAAAVARQDTVTEIANSETADAAGWTRRKQALLDASIASKAEGSSPLPHYRALHQLLEESRRQLGAIYASLDDAAQRARSMKMLAEVVHDRTWSFALFRPGDLSRLRDEVDSTMRRRYG